MVTAHIDDYSFGRMVVDGDEHTFDLILTPSGVHPDWWRPEGHRCTADDLEPVLDDPPEVLVIGTGASGRMRPDEQLAQTLRTRGIASEVHTTDPAVARFNQLAASGTRLAGAFHLTC